jgi:hypothetical protein
LIEDNASLLNKTISSMAIEQHIKLVSIDSEDLAQMLHL